MPNLFEISNFIKEKASNPRNTLENLPNIQPFTIKRQEILSVSKIAKYIFLVHSPTPIYISTVFNKSFKFESEEYTEIILKKCYDSIYFDLCII